MGWRGTIRSINAAAKRAEREADRRYKAQLKQEIADTAAEAVAAWAAHIEKLKSLHHEVPDAVDWHQIAATPPPAKPEPDVPHTKAAKRALDAFQPKLSDRLRFGGAEKRRQRLLQKLEEAKDVDRDRYRQRLQDYEIAKAEWKADTETAKQTQKQPSSSFEATPKR